MTDRSAGEVVHAHTNLCVELLLTEKNAFINNPLEYMVLHMFHEFVFDLTHFEVEVDANTDWDWR